MNSKPIHAERYYNGDGDRFGDIADWTSNLLMKDSPTRLMHLRQCPSGAVLHFCLLLAGFATALLGPILPLLSLRWHLSDQQGGLLLLAQFCGATAGGLTVSMRLERSLALGLAAATIGFSAFAVAPTLPFVCLSLLVAGWGVGQLIAAGNIIAGRRYAEHRGSALALLNFSFSLGAMLSPFLAAQLTPHYQLRPLLSGFAASFAIVLLGLLLDLRADLRAAQTSQYLETTAVTEGRLTPRIWLYFGLLLFLYGGVETSLDGWLTTFATRYGNRTPAPALAISQYTTLVLWASLTAGRALSSMLLLRITEATLQRAGLLVTAIGIAALAMAHGALVIALLAGLLGLSLAPFFPSTFALLMADRPSARQAGVILAVSGLGAAFLPSLMGLVSTRFGSLQIALAIPLTAAACLLALSIFSPTKPRLHNS